MVGRMERRISSQETDQGVAATAVPLATSQAEAEIIPPPQLNLCCAKNTQFRIRLVSTACRNKRAR